MLCLFCNNDQVLPSSEFLKKYKARSLFLKEHMSIGTLLSGVHGVQT